VREVRFTYFAAVLTIIRSDMDSGMDSWGNEGLVGSERLRQAAALHVMRRKIDKGELIAVYYCPAVYNPIVAIRLGRFRVAFGSLLLDGCIYPIQALLILVDAKWYHPYHDKHRAPVKGEQYDLGYEAGE